jgi:pimeloyl-ACP methyl ester carboxylesterase
MSVRVEAMRALLEPAELRELEARLARTRWSGSLTPGWEAGVPEEWLRELVESWRRFDVRGFQKRLDALSHLRVDVDGQVVHAVHVKGVGPNPLPLVLTHGWPGSFCEYLNVIGPLTDPGRHGGDPRDAFGVVIPSLPGFGFSAPAPPGATARDVAHLWHRLMTEGLGYQRYVAHGSDLGAGITAWLARMHPEAVAAVHLATPGLGTPPEPHTVAESRYFAETAEWIAEEGGYGHEQSTKPATLGVALQDSAAGLAAWIGEKVRAWSSTDGDGETAFDLDLLLGTLTLFWATGTITTSFMPYWAYRHLSGTQLPADQQPPVPTAVTIFGGERVPFPKPPRELAERFFDVADWEEHDRGGHFPAVVEPELLAATLRKVFRGARAPSA